MAKKNTSKTSKNARTDCFKSANSTVKRTKTAAVKDGSWKESKTVGASTLTDSRTAKRKSLALASFSAAYKTQHKTSSND